MASLASTAVALIVLVDMATGQGPPGLNNFIGGGPEYGPPGRLQGPGLLVGPGLPPPLPPMRAVGGYGDEEKLEKEYEKDRAKFEKLEKKEGFKEFKEFKKHDKEFEKEYEKHAKKGGGYDRDYEYKPTEEPGYLASISSGMSNVWSRFRGSSNDE